MSYVHELMVLTKVDFLLLDDEIGKPYIDYMGEHHHSYLVINWYRIISLIPFKQENKEME